MFIIFILSYKYCLNCLVPSFTIKQRNKLLLHRFIIILIKVISKIKKIRNNDNNNISDSINPFYQFFIFIFFFNYFTGSLYFSRLTTTFSEVSPATVSAKTNFPNSF